VLGDGKIIHSARIGAPRPRHREHPDQVALRLQLLSELGVPADSVD
jgi:sulfonate transport system ATP-binding protein